jgi:hypothetical protein
MPFLVFAKLRILAKFRTSDEISLQQNCPRIFVKKQEAYFAKADYFIKLPRALAPVGFFAKLSGEEISLPNIFAKQLFSRKYAKISCH